MNEVYERLIRTRNIPLWNVRLTDKTIQGFVVYNYGTKFAEYGLEGLTLDYILKDLKYFNKEYSSWREGTDVRFKAENYRRN